MKGKKQLEIYLQGLQRKDHYINYLEQYTTDAASASHVLMTAFNDGNIAGRNVADLGTGNGIFACGASFLGAAGVLGIDSDEEQISVASGNCESDNTRFMAMDVQNLQGEFDTVIMNPPFGSVITHSDMPFLLKAVSVADYIYSIHNIKSRNFIREFYQSHGEIIRDEQLSIRVGRLYSHHTKDSALIPASFFTVRVHKRHGT